MELFDNHDIDVIDGEVLRRVVKFANSSYGDLSNAADDIENLKKNVDDLIEKNKTIETLVKDVENLKHKDEDIETIIKTIEKVEERNFTIEAMIMAKLAEVENKTTGLSSIHLFFFYFQFIQINVILFVFSIKMFPNFWKSLLQAIIQ